MFTLEVTLGNLMTVGSILAGWGIYIVALKGKVELLMQALAGIDRRLTAVETTMTAHTQYFLQLAKQEVLLDNLADRIQDLEDLNLKHG